MKKKAKQWGFTLIEVMLLVMVVAIISFYSITSLRTKENVVAEQATVVALQHWLEAGLAYYVDTGTWPVDNQTLINGGFLPSVSECSHWSGSSSNAACSSRAAFQVRPNSQKMYFQVQLTLPNTTVAKRIQAQLPGSYLSGATVIASIGQPIEGWLAAGGVINSTGTITLPQCPEGFEGHFILTPQYFSTGWASYVKDLSCIGADPKSTAVRLGLDNNPNLSDLLYYNRVDTGDGNNAKQAYFLTFCIANGLWNAQTWSRCDDAQCVGTWQSYNNSPDAKWNSKCNSCNVPY